MSFTVGQRVVCIDDRFPDAVHGLYREIPVAGSVYRVRSVSLGCDWSGAVGEVAICLEGLKNPRSSRPPYPERAFNAERFAPLEEESVPCWAVASDGVGENA